jgi:S-DNA-T family DNA segregation ATPase FtsK/SpoIIIE
MENTIECPAIGLEKLYKDEDWWQFENQPVIPLGIDMPTNSLVGNLSNNFNLILTGKTGSGKSNFFHCAIVNLVRNTKPKDLKLILIDPKRVEFSLYGKLPNLLFPVILNCEDAKKALQWCMDEGKRRLQLLHENKKKKAKTAFQRIAIIIDEFSDLMYADRNFFEKAILDILKHSAMSDINILIGTSRPSVEVYPKKMIAAFQYKIAFAVAAASDSKTIIGYAGAEELPGKGRMLIRLPDRKIPALLQGFYISEEEIKKCINGKMVNSNPE